MTENENKDKELDAILDYNDKETKENKAFSKISKTNLIIIIVSFIIIAIVAFTFIPNKKDNAVIPNELEAVEQQAPQGITEEEYNTRQTNYIDNNILFYQFYYQNNSIYYDLCKNNGYNLDGFTLVLNNKFKEQIDEVNRMFEILKGTAPTLQEDLNKDIDERLRARVESEFNFIRKGLITQHLAATNNIAPENVEWNDSYLETFPISQACKYIDENADEILSATYSMIVPLYK